MKKIQQNNKKLFHWIIGGVMGWIVTAISFIVWIFS